MDMFEKNRYYNQYVEALNASRRAKELLDLARQIPPTPQFPPTPPDKIAELEAEYKAAQEKTDDLWCLYNYGVHKNELDAMREPPKNKLKFNTGWADRPDRFRPREFPQ